jgi:hypothetical protein
MNILQTSNIKVMEQTEQKERDRIWDARTVLTFNRAKIRLNILVLANSKTSAEEKAIEWTKKYEEDNRKLIGARLGYDAKMSKDISVQVLGTSYCAFI